MLTFFSFNFPLQTLGYRRFYKLIILFFTKKNLVKNSPKPKFLTSFFNLSFGTFTTATLLYPERGISTLEEPK